VFVKKGEGEQLRQGMGLGTKGRDLKGHWIEFVFYSS
jgi:hypothetical protein